MLRKYKFNLQLFAEGGDGGDGGAAPAGEAVEGTSGDVIPSSVPVRARKNYQKAIERNVTVPKTPEVAQTTDEPQTAAEKLSYADLIKSDEYKEEHEAYMQKTIGDRLKKYKDTDAENAKMRAALETVANKYGVNPNDTNFLEVLGQKIEADDSYYEEYAMKHDISAEDARRVVTMERKMAKFEADEQARVKQEQMRQQMMLLNQNAEKTKAQFPGFDLATEMQDEKFRKLCAVNNGDTTAAYMACHWNEILPATVQMASKQIQAQTAKTVASNKARPIENGMSSQAPSVAQKDFRNMSLNELRAYASEQRRKSGR